MWGPWMLPIRQRDVTRRPAGIVDAPFKAHKMRLSANVYTWLRASGTSLWLRSRIEINWRFFSLTLFTSYCYFFTLLYSSSCSGFFPLWPKSFLSEDVPLVEFMHLVFTRMPGESNGRRLGSLLLYLCYVFRALINSLVCWFNSK